MKHYELALIELYDDAISEATHQAVLRRFQRAKENKVLLQELVNRATPMKPNNLKNRREFMLGRCPQCDNLCVSTVKYCPECGQAMDFSTDK